MQSNHTEGSFASLVELINNSQSKEELREAAEKWKPNIEQYDVDEWVNHIFSDDIRKLDLQKLPEVLDVFYRSMDKFKFMLFCMLLEATIDDLPYLTNLEDERLFVGKWNILKQTVCTIIRHSNSKLVDCIYLILLQNDPTGHYLTAEERQDVIFGNNVYLEGIYQYLTNAETIDPSVYRSLEIVLDAATYFNDAKTQELIGKMEKLQLDEEASMFLIKYQLANRQVADQKRITALAENNVLNQKFFRILDSIGKLSILSDQIDQEKIASSKMIEWLLYPTELGELPTEISLLESLELDHHVYYLFRFKTDAENFKDRGSMLGVAGGYEKNQLTTDNTGIVFSKFEELKENYHEQGLQLIQFIQNYWKEREESESA